MKKFFIFMALMAFWACGNKQSSQAGVEVDSLANAEVAETEVPKYAEQVKELQTSFENSVKTGAEIYEYIGTIGDQKAKLAIVGNDDYYGSLELGEGDAMETIYLKGYQEVALLSLEGYSADQKCQFEALYQEDSSLEGSLKIDDKELKAKLKEKGPKEDPEITKMIEEYQGYYDNCKELLESGMPTGSTTMMRFFDNLDSFEKNLKAKEKAMTPAQLENYKKIAKNLKTLVDKYDE